MSVFTGIGQTLMSRPEVVNFVSFKAWIRSQSDFEGGVSKQLFHSKCSRLWLKHVYILDRTVAGDVETMYVLWNVNMTVNLWYIILMTEWTLNSLLISLFIRVILLFISFIFVWFCLFGRDSHTYMIFFKRPRYLIHSIHYFVIG